MTTGPSPVLGSWITRLYSGILNSEAQKRSFNGVIAKVATAGFDLIPPWTY